jgi:hypothetical protein
MIVAGENDLFAETPPPDGYTRTGAVASLPLVIF